MQDVALGPHWKFIIHNVISQCLHQHYTLFYIILCKYIAWLLRSSTFVIAFLVVVIFLDLFFLFRFLSYQFNWYYPNFNIILLIRLNQNVQIMLDIEQLSIICKRCILLFVAQFNKGSRQC